MSGAYLWFVEPHVVAHDVELNGSGTSVTFDPVSVEQQRVAQLVAQRQGEAELMLVSEAVQHVEHRAAGRLVGFEEHDVGVGLTGAQWGALSIRGGEDGLYSWLDTAGEQKSSVTATHSETLKRQCSSEPEAIPPVEDGSQQLTSKNYHHEEKKSLQQPEGSQATTHQPPHHPGEQERRRQEDEGEEEERRSRKGDVKIDKHFKVSRISDTK